MKFLLFFFIYFLNIKIYRINTSKLKYLILNRYSKKILHKKRNIKEVIPGNMIPVPIPIILKNNTHIKIEKIIN